MLLCKIGQYDLTPMMIRGSYSVNEVDSFKAWQNGYGRSRRSINGTKIAGSFSFKPRTQEEYEEVVAKIEEAKNEEGITEASVYVLNKGIHRTIGCYFDIDMSLDSNGTDRLWMKAIKVNLEEV